MRIMAGPRMTMNSRREDAADEREEHLDGRLGGHLLGTLATLDAELLGLHLEDVGDGHTELFGLDDGADEVGQGRHVGATHHLLERVASRLADANLCERPAELVGERTLGLLDDLGQRGVEAETGLDRDGEQVERVRDAPAGSPSGGP